MNSQQRRGNIRLKAMKYGPVYVDLSPVTGVRFGTDNSTELEASPPADAPALTLLASLGSCLAMSMDWCAKQRKVPINPFTVVVVGVKATDLPSRFERIEVVFKETENEAPTLDAELLEQAKQICTVSNTLDCSIEYSFS